MDRTFSGIRPTAQGKIVLNFVPVVGMACVNGIEVVEDTNSCPVPRRSLIESD